MHADACPVHRLARNTRHRHACATAFAVCVLCRRLREHLLATGHPRLGILALMAALERLRPTPEHLTPIHQDVLLL